MTLFHHPFSLWHGDSDGGGGVPPAEVHEDTERSRRILEFFPRWMQSSNLIELWSIAIAEEVTSRIGDLYFMWRRQTRPTLVTDDGFPYWFEALQIPDNPSEPADLKRAKILSKFRRANRIRLEDIANIVRFYLDGNITFISSTTTNSKIIQVRDVTGFTPGTQVFIGGFATSIVSIDAGRREFTLADAVTAPAYTVVADSIVEVEEDIPNYAFVIRLDASTVFDLNEMIRAIAEARPAHLDFTVVDLATDAFLFEDAASLLEGTRTFGPKVLKAN